MAISFSTSPPRFAPDPASSGSAAFACVLAAADVTSSISFLGSTSVFPIASTPFSPTKDASFLSLSPITVIFAPSEPPAVFAVGSSFALISLTGVVTGDNFEVGLSATGEFDVLVLFPFEAATKASAFGISKFLPVSSIALFPDSCSNPLACFSDIIFSFHASTFFPSSYAGRVKTY